jgi:hypothetical protein
MPIQKRPPGIHPDGLFSQCPVIHPAMDGGRNQFIGFLLRKNSQLKIRMEADVKQTLLS